MNFAQGIQGIGSIFSPILAPKALFQNVDGTDAGECSMVLSLVALVVVALAVVFFTSLSAQRMMTTSRRWLFNDCLMPSWKQGDMVRIELSTDSPLVRSVCHGDVTLVRRNRSGICGARSLRPYHIIRPTRFGIKRSHTPPSPLVDSWRLSSPTWGFHHDSSSSPICLAPSSLLC